VACKQDLSSRRPDSNRGPLHYEGRTSEGRASTRGHARALSRWKLSVLELSRRTRVPARARADVPVSYLVQPPHDAISNRRPCARMLSSSRSATTSRVVLVPKGRFPRAAAGRGSSTSGERRAHGGWPDPRAGGPATRSGGGRPYFFGTPTSTASENSEVLPAESVAVAGHRGVRLRSLSRVLRTNSVTSRGRILLRVEEEEVSNGRFGAHRRVPLRDHLG
jgi:hypothetical protein